jgi:hypothetical protein
MDITQLTWEALKEAIPLSVFLMLFMTVLGKLLIDAVHDIFWPLFHRKVVNPTGFEWRKVNGGAKPADYDFRSIVVNVITFGIGLLVTALHVALDFSWGNAVVNALVATGLAVGEFEGVKNTIKALRAV